MSPTPPRVSVLLPVFNGGPHVERAIDSIRCQTFRDWELIVVDDGSTDDTRQRLEALARSDGRIRVRHLSRSGIVSALEAGLGMARGEWIARMDADDLSHPERLAEQLDFADAHPDLGLIGSLVDFGEPPAEASTETTSGGEGYAAHVHWLNSVVTEAEVSRARFIESPFAHPSVMFRRDCHRRHGGYRDGEFPEDYELWLRWLEAGVRMAKVPRVLLTWNDRPDRLSRTDPRYNLDAFYRLKARHLSRWLRPMIGIGRPVWVWGAGRVTRKRVAWLVDEGVHIDRYVDIASRKQGRQRDGRLVVGPESIPPPGEIVLVGFVASRGAREFQRAFLDGRGWREGIDYVFAA